MRSPCREVAVYVQATVYVQIKISIKPSDLESGDSRIVLKCQSCIFKLRCAYMYSWISIKPSDLGFLAVLADLEGALMRPLLHSFALRSHLMGPRRWRERGN